jgi:hypothetical protein
LLRIAAYECAIINPERVSFAGENHSLLKCRTVALRAIRGDGGLSEGRLKNVKTVEILPHFFIEFPGEQTAISLTFA